MNDTFIAKIVRPNGDEYSCAKNNRVTIPFYEEYGVYVKNTIGKRRMFELIVDGEPVGEGRKYILGPYEEMTVKRWLEGDMNSGSKFIFLPVDHPEGQKKAERAEAGLVRVKMWTEEPESKNVIECHYRYPYYYRMAYPEPEWEPYPHYYRRAYWESYPYYPTWCTTTGSGSSMTYCSANVQDLPVEDISEPVINSFAPRGVTGKGADSGQQFVSSTGFGLGSDVEEIIFFLVPPEDQAVAVEAGLKPKAHYCGHCRAKRKDANHVFCPYCSRKY